MKVCVLASGRGSNLEALIKYTKNNNSHFRVTQVISDNKNSNALEIARIENISQSIVTKKKVTLLEKFLQKS